MRLRGGLGNQLFQYWAGRVVAAEAHGDLHLDVTETTLTHDRIGLTALALEGHSLCSWRPTGGRSPAFDLEWLRLRETWSTRFGRTTLGTLSEILDYRAGNDPRNETLDGFFTSFKIPNAAREHGLSLAMKPRRPTSWFHAMSKCAARDQPLMVHVRRGDYSANPFWGLLDEPYYRNALQSLGYLNDQPVWVFSDDPQAAMNLMEGLVAQRDLRVILPPEGVPAAESLLLMALGSGLVTANSTMSWWAGQVSGARVTVPVPFHPAMRADQDLTTPEALFSRPNWLPIASAWT